MKYHKIFVREKVITEGSKEENMNKKLKNNFTSQISYNLKILDYHQNSVI